MNPSTEFSIEGKPCSFSFLLKSLGEELDKTHKLQEFISRLEEERLKIDAFKRELPLCMQLLNDAMEASRQQLAAGSQANHNPMPVLEEFIPLKHQETSERSLNCTVDATTATAAGTGSWMATTQIWSQSNDGSKNQGPAVSMEPEHGLVGSSKLALDVKQRVGGAFLPFSKERNGATQQGLRSQLPDLELAPSDKNGDETKRPETVELAVPISRIKANDQSSASQGNCNGGGGVVGGATEKISGNEVQAAGGGQTHRKPRRCWSPDLHRRFVNALQQLGGSHAATPKQIRELMKVDGLTNDEVKSHLQKYRLHTRRPSPTPQAVTTPATQLVVLGGIWVQPEYTTAAHTAATGIYSATIAAAAAAQSAPPTTQPLPPTHYCHPSPLPQDFCTQLSTPPHHQLRHVYCDQQLTANHNGNAGDKDKNDNSNSGSDDNNNKTSSNSRSSPRSSTAGERSQSVEEEGRSESGSWRGESTENEGGRSMGRALSLKRRTTLRSEEEEDGEESTGSDITLKF
ncbi:myb family transcription factor EFM-like isoform X1 [Nymphaea colorata]|nr:myb family transcription factor EFM-like isoform X1 [Nymphaea colorata]